MTPAKVYQLPGTVLGQALLVPDFDLIVIIANTQVITLDTKGLPSQRVSFSGHAIEELPQCWHTGPIPGIQGMVYDIGRIYCTAGKNLYQLDAEGGVVKSKFRNVKVWAQVSAQANLMSPLQAKDYLYIVDEDGVAYQVRKLDGGIQWHKKWGSAGKVSRPPFLNGDLLYFFKEAALYAVNLANGKEAWTRPVELARYDWQAALAPSTPVVTKNKTVLVPLNVPLDDESGNNGSKLIDFLQSQVPPSPVGAGAYGTGASASLSTLYPVNAHGVGKWMPTVIEKGVRGGNLFYDPTEILVSPTAWAKDASGTVAFVALERRWEHFAGVPSKPQTNWLIGLLDDGGAGTVSQLVTPFPDITGDPHVFLVPDPLAAANEALFWVAWDSSLTKVQLTADGATASVKVLKSYTLDGLNITTPPVIANDGKLYVTGSDNANQSWLAVYNI